MLAGRLPGRPTYVAQPLPMNVMRMQAAMNVMRMQTAMNKIIRMQTAMSLMNFKKGGTMNVMKKLIWAATDQRRRSGFTNAVDP